MKATKILVMLLALVLVFALVACGGEKEPEVTEDATATTTTAAAATTTKAAATTTKAAATTTKAAATTTAAPVVTTTAAPAAVEFPNTMEEYNSLFVADANVLHLNFAEATPDSPSLVGSANYEDETVSAINRFQGAASNYTDYLFNSVVENPVYGGTAKILTPWYFEDWFADWTVKMTTSNVDYLRTVEPEEYAKTGVQSGTTVYVVNTQVEETEYYIGNGVWAKKTYASTWGNGYLNLGTNTNLHFTTAAKYAAENNPGYTIQFVFKREGTSNLATFLGERLVFSGTSAGISIKRSDSSYYPDLQPVTIEGGDLNAINCFTISYDRTDKSAVAINMYLNSALASSQTVAEKKMDGMWKLFEQTNGSVYAVRVYGKVLSAEEVAQNHFADLALVCHLDITEFLKLDDAAKATVYTALADYTYDIPQMLLQKALNDAIAAAK